MNAGRRRLGALELLAVAVVLVVVTGLAAAEHGSGRPPSPAQAQQTVQQAVDQAFTVLFPDKAEVNSRTEEPHVSLGTVTLGRGLAAEGFVTTAPGVYGCELVVDIDAREGVYGGIVSGCGGWPAGGAALGSINGALIGWVSDASVAQVTVAGAGYQVSATVVAQHFIVAPPAAAVTGFPLTVTGLAAGGATIGSWSVALNEWNLSP